MSVEGFAPERVRDGRLVAVSPVTDEPFLVTRWVDHGGRRVTALEKRPIEDRLFVPLYTEPYRAFESGAKDVELRGLGPRFNRETVYPGRPVELRRGYSTGDSLWGLVGEVRVFEALEAVPREYRERIKPGAGREAFVESATELLGNYDRLIAFEVVLGAEVPQP